MRAVSDTGPLIGLAKGQCFGLLEKLFDEVLITTAVWNEIMAGGGQRPGVAEVAAARGTFLHLRDPDPTVLATFPTTLQEGERSALALAQEIGVDFVLVDDQSARSEATRRGMDWAMTPDVVRMMKQQGLIPAVKPVLDTMQRNGFGLKRTLYRVILRQAGEWKSRS